MRRMSIPGLFLSGVLVCLLWSVSWAPVDAWWSGGHFLRSGASHVGTAFLVVDVDLMMQKTSAPNPFVLGVPATYTLTVSNLGSDTATGVVVEDELPATLEFQSVIPSSLCNFDTATRRVTCQLGEMAGGSQTVIHIGVLPTATGELENTATVSSDQGVFDPPANNSDTENTPVVSPPLITALKTDALAVDNDGNRTPSPGDVIEYTITIFNDGDVDAEGVIFTDVPDPNTILINGSVVSSQGVVLTGNNPGDTQVVVDLGTIPAHASAAILFQVQIGDALPQGVNSVLNQGTVSGDNFADTPTDDSDTAVPGDPTGTFIIQPGGAAPAPVPATTTGGLIGLTLGLGLILVLGMSQRFKQLRMT